MIRSGLLLGSGAALAGPGLLLRVHAAGDEPGKQRQTKFRPSQFPIYGEPEPAELEIIPEVDSAFRQYISAVRKWTWNYLESIQNTTNMVKEKWEVGKAHTQDALAYIREDSAVIPRATLITVAGLGGIVAGYRGGVVRKVVYASFGMTAAASLCYPHEAEDIAKRGLHVVRDFAHDSFGGSKGKRVEPKKPIKEADIKHEEKPTSTQNADESVKKDFGMSKAEDKDMYTTRGN